MIDMDDIKVALATISGIGNWLLQVDILLQVLISLASLFYIIAKCAQLIKERKKGGK